MLALSRKKGESVVIRALDGSEVTVTVYEIRGDKVRLSFDASLDYQIRRVAKLGLMEESNVDQSGGSSGSVLDPVPPADFCGGAVGEAAGQVGPVV